MIEDYSDNEDGINFFKMKISLKVQGHKRARTKRMSTFSTRRHEIDFVCFSRSVPLEETSNLLQFFFGVNFIQGLRQIKTNEDV